MKLRPRPLTQAQATRSRPPLAKACKVRANTGQNQSCNSKANTGQTVPSWAKLTSKATTGYACYAEATTGQGRVRATMGRGHNARATTGPRTISLSNWATARVIAVGPTGLSALTEPTQGTAPLHRMFPTSGSPVVLHWTLSSPVTCTCKRPGASQACS